MQVWVLNDENVYGALKQAMERAALPLQMVENSHSLGFRSLQIDRAGVQVLGLLLVPVSDQIIFQATQWIHKTWQVSDFLNFDALTCLKSDLFSHGQDYLTAIPKRCLRSAGRGDLQTGPLLYESMAFSDSVQMALAQQFGGDAGSLIDPQLNLFSGFGLEHDVSFEQTIAEHVNCFAWDNTSGEMIQSCRRLAVRAGAFYVVAPRHEYRLGALDAFLRVNKTAIFGPLP